MCVHLQIGALVGAKSFETLQDLALAVKASCDIAFPAMHGKYGEDGGVQALLETNQIPFVGSGAAQAARAFDKVRLCSSRTAGQPVGTRGKNPHKQMHPTNDGRR